MKLRKLTLNKIPVLYTVIKKGCDKLNNFIEIYKDHVKIREATKQGYAMGYYK